jgi:hypothetical protein
MLRSFLINRNFNASTGVLFQLHFIKKMYNKKLSIQNDLNKILWILNFCENKIDF